jgi:hypothetical protein
LLDILPEFSTVLRSPSTRTACLRVLLAIMEHELTILLELALLVIPLLFELDMVPELVMLSLSQSALMPPELTVLLALC